MTPERWQRALALFGEALQQPDGERDRWLERSCGDDSELLELVQNLLSTDAEIAARSIVPASAVFARSETPELNIGDELGPYRIVSFLGAGGMGQVFRAERVDGVVKQEVAVKLLRHSASAAELRRRFAIERRILARLNHPGIARFIDAGADAAGRPFVVMELIDGVSITTFAREKKLGLAERLVLFAQVLDAVAYAHAQLIVHRDIKPSNVLVDHTGAARLLDFGIAKPLSDIDEALRAEGNTETTMRAFSLKYAAPEQLKGEAIGVGCDVYALGGLLYELLTDVPALELKELALLKAQERIFHQMPEAPSSRQLGVDIPYGPKALKGDLDRIVLHALKKEANERYATVDAFASDIRSHIRQEPISLRRGVTSYRLSKFIRRNKLAVAISTIFILSLIGFSAALLVQASRLALEKENALSSAAQAVKERDRAQRVSRFMVKLFNSARTVESNNPNPTVTDLLQGAAERIRVDIKNGVETDWRIIESLADAQGSNGMWKEAIQLRSLVEPLAAKDPETTQNDLLRSTINKIEDYVNIQDIRTVKELLSKVPIQEVTSLDTVQLEMLRASYLIDPFTQPKAYEESLKPLIYKSVKILGDKHSFTINLRMSLANFYRDVGRFDEARKLLELLRIQNLTLPETHPYRIAIIHNYALLYINMKDSEKAEPFVLQAVESAKKQYGEKSGLYARVLGISGQLYEIKGEYEKAIAVNQNVREIYSEQLGDMSPALYVPLANMTGIYIRNIKDFGEALKLSDSLAKIFEVNGAAIEKKSVWAAQRAMILNGIGRYKETLRHCAELEPLIETSGLSNNRRLAQLKMEKAYALLKVGNDLEAKQNFDASVIIMADFADEWDTARRAETQRLLAARVPT